MLNGMTWVLTLHILSAVVWLGGALYETFFVFRNVREHRGSVTGLAFIRVFLGAAPYFAISIITLIVTGILLTVMTGGGFFQVPWLGIKQGVMLTIVLIIVTFIMPRMKVVEKEVTQAIEKGCALTESTYQRLTKVWRMLDLIHVLAVINIILAVWKP
jgi:uncharacterized membrane protein